MHRSLDARELRARLAEARTMLLFTPALVLRGDPLEVLASVLPEVDVVQVRPKPLESARTAITEARAAHDLARSVLALVRARPEPRPLVIVNDRVDVARALTSEGIAGVHLGQHDCPVELARALLGAVPLVGLSTRSGADLARAEESEAVDYVGFGPVFATPTKGYARGLGAERAWVARHATSRPLFAIGGIGRTNVAELARVGRIAVGAAILSADDPSSAARELRALLEQD